YRPQPVPRVLQTKKSSAAPSVTPSSNVRKTVPGPPVYNPNRTPHVLQRFTANRSSVLQRPDLLSKTRPPRTPGMGKTIQLSSQKSSVTPSPQPTPKPAPVPVKNPWAKVNQVVVNNENKNAFPSLADVGQKDKETLKKELEQIRQESLLQVAEAEEEEKARKGKKLATHNPIQKLATRE